MEPRAYEIEAGLVAMVMDGEVTEDRVPGLDGRTGPGFRPFQKPVVQLSSMTTLKQSTLHFSMV